MKKVLKQVVGIDVAQDELVCTFGKFYEDCTIELCSRSVFKNGKEGFKKLDLWLKTIVDVEVHLRYVMEATGVYHEAFAYYLDEHDLEVSIILPNKISNYARSLDIKTVTDKTASEAITLFGLERRLDRWHRPNVLLKTLSQLTRERSQLIAERTVLKNQLHAEKAQAIPYLRSVDRIQKRIMLLNKQEKEIKQELLVLVKTDEEIKRKIKLMCSLSGIGFLTAVNVFAETNGFNLIRNKRQLTSYAGLDVKEKQSGTSVKGKPRISKKGNRHLRKAMHLPALSAIKHDKRFKAIFIRLVSKHGIKMKAVVAVQRKLLEMMYTLCKTGIPYDKNYLNNEDQELVGENEKIGSCQ